MDTLEIRGDDLRVGHKIVEGKKITLEVRQIERKPHGVHVNGTACYAYVGFVTVKA